MALLTEEEMKWVDSLENDVKTILKSKNISKFSFNKMEGIRKQIKDSRRKDMSRVDLNHLLFSLFSQVGNSQGCKDVFGEEQCSKYIDFAKKYETKNIGVPVVKVPGTGPAPSDQINFPHELLEDFYSVELIGEGGFGRVFKAINTKTGETSVIKLMRQVGKETGSSFIDEVASWRSLQHENIVRFKSANIFPRPYIEIEYIDNGSLEDQLLPMEWRKALLITIQILEALDYSHSRNILHLDIKPGNILLTKGMKPKVSDWNLSKLKSDNPHSKTIKGGFSLEFAAPEQLDSSLGKVGEWTDIYQVGETLYYMVTGKLPFLLGENESIDQFKQRVLNEYPDKPSSINPELTSIDSIVSKALNKQPGARYRTAKEMLDDIKIVLNYSREKVTVIESGMPDYNERKVEKTMTEEAKKPDTGQNEEKIVINNIVGNSLTGTNDDQSKKTKAGKSMLFAGEHLRELLRDEKYSQIVDWLSRNKEFIAEKNPQVSDQLTQYFIPNLNAMIKFGIPTPEGFRERFEALISSLS